MHLAHHPIFIALSILTAWLGAWTALDLFRRMQSHVGVWRRAWVIAAGIAMGLSIWSMHFIAMLGFDPGTQVRYDVSLTLLSLLIAIVTTTLAFLAARPIRSRQLGSGLLMGAGICGMHYVGMAAVVTGATISHEPVIVVLAFIVAVSAATGALIVAMRETTFAERVLAAFVLGFAIVGMHYTAMLGVHIDVDPSAAVRSVGIDAFVLAIGVAAGTLFILLLALIAAMSDRRFEALAVREAMRTQQQLRAILDNLPMGIFVAASPSGEIRFANAEAVQLLGHPVGGAALWAHGGDHGALDASGRRLTAEEHALYKAMHENRPVGPVVQRYRRGDGKLIQLEVTAAPLSDYESKESLSLAAFQDVTDKLHAEEQARQAAALRESEERFRMINDLLEQRVAAALAEKADAEAALMHAQRLESLGRLTGGVAHDFNNLLTVVIGALDIILRHPDDAMKRDRLGEAALAAARRGERLTAQLLAFARRQPLQPEICDLNELIRDCEPLLRRAAGDNVTLSVRLSAGKAVALIDRTQFEACLLNLVVNAVDASASGGEIHIATEIVPASNGEASSGSVRMHVRDRGEGMSADVVNHIFEPFYTTKGPGKGTGLGLSQVYGFVKQSGGEVHVESEQGKGTCMTVVLPLQAPVAEAVAQRTVAPAALARALKVLLTEDDPSVAAITQAMLMDLGHDAVCASSAAQALDILRSDAVFDVLLTDVLMPGGMDGVDLACEAVKIRPGLGVLLCSGYAGESLDDSVACGVWPFLRKPYLQSELAEALARIVVEPNAEAVRGSDSSEPRQARA